MNLPSKHYFGYSSVSVVTRHTVLWGNLKVYPSPVFSFSTAFELRGADLPFFSCREKHFGTQKNSSKKKIKKS
jgi:hypothetical protein